MCPFFSHPGHPFRCKVCHTDNHHVPHSWMLYKLRRNLVPVLFGAGVLVLMVIWKTCLQ
jgi:hypothetical protein